MIGKKIGILGGGQLGRMMLEASMPLNLDISVLDAAYDYPSAPICSKFILGDFTNYEDVIKFGSELDVISIEIESVNVEALEVLEAKGKTIYPQPSVLKIINDKGLQKQFYLDNNIPTAPVRFYNDKSEILSEIENGTLNYPFVNKLRKGGYDGRGVSIVKSKDDLNLLFNAPTIIEERIKIDKEIAVMVARTREGKMVTYPIVEMEFHPTANLVEFLFAPSDLSKQIENQATALALKIAEKLDIVGILAIEMFIDISGNVIVNEMAPRAHNSMHFTIEGCRTSQFMQLLRILLGLELGNTKLLQPSVMINLLGEEGYSGLAKYEGIQSALETDGVHIHLYGKPITKPKRKMGHITIVNQDLEKAKDMAKELKEIIKVKA
jgi:5-(carboxyamino)imidazole ribonucleotide synthase